MNFQIIWAIVQSLKSDKNMQIELLLSIEKLVSQNVAVSRDSSSVLTQVIIKLSLTRLIYKAIRTHIKNKMKSILAKHHHKNTTRQKIRY